MKHIWYQVSYFLMMASLATLGVIYYFMFLRDYKIFEVFNVEIMTPEVEAGKVVQYKVDYCKYQDIPGKVSKTLVDGYFVPFVPYNAQALKGCGSVVVQERIPDFIGPGTYHIEIIAEYHPNPLKTVKYKYKTPDFTVR